MPSITGRAKAKQSGADCVDNQPKRFVRLGRQFSETVWNRKTLLVETLRVGNTGCFGPHSSPETCVPRESAQQEVSAANVCAEKELQPRKLAIADASVPVFL